MQSQQGQEYIQPCCNSFIFYPASPWDGSKPASAIGPSCACSCSACMYPRPQRCLQDYRKRAGCSNRGCATIGRARGQQPDVGGDDGHPYTRFWPESTWECWLLEVCTLAGACQMPAHTPCSLCAARVPGAQHHSSMF